MPVFSRKTVILDLGASRTALGVFSRSNGRLRLDSFAVETLPEHSDGDAYWLEQTRSALTILRKRASTGRRVVLVLPPHLTLTKLIKTPRVAPAKREKILRFEAEQSIPYAPTDVVWDTVVAAEHENELEVLLAAAKLEAIESLCAMLQTSGFEPYLVLPSCLATLAAFRLVRGEGMEATLVLNLGARSTTLLQVTGQRFAARSLALGTRNIMGKTADQPDPVALQIIATRLAQEMTRSVLHFRRQGGLESPARICLAGGGARLTGLGEALAEKFKMPVDRLDSSGTIGLGRGVSQDQVIGHAMTLADLIGAATTQLRPQQPVLNLLPPSLRQQASRRRRLRLVASSLVAAAALWPLMTYLRPAVERGRVAEVIRQETVPRLAETFAPPTAASINKMSEEFFDLELLDVKAAPFPLQVGGYFGEPGDYCVAFISAEKPEILLARRGHRFEQLGLTFRSFEVRKVAVNHEDPWPVYEFAGFAVLQDERTGAEVILDSRRKPARTLQAVLRGVADHQPSTRQEGELIVQGSVTYRIQRIQADPPEVVVVRQAAGRASAETRVLQPIRATINPGGQSAEPAIASVPSGL